MFDPKGSALKKFIIILLCSFAVITFVWSIPVSAQDETSLVLNLTVDGPLTPSWKEYLERGIRVAEQREAELLILQINTPGGMN
jgi:membrane-bound serine protease (ClpP class)